MVDSIGDLILIFCLKLSIGQLYYQGGTHLIDLGCQSASYEITFTLERHFFTHKTLVHKTLFTGSDDPALGRMIWLAQPVRLWTRPDDPAVVVGVRLNLSVQVRMIRT